jgi:hypothetical protein
VLKKKAQGQIPQQRIRVNDAHARGKGAIGVPGCMEDQVKFANARSQRFCFDFLSRATSAENRSGKKEMNAAEQKSHNAGF